MPLDPCFAAMLQSIAQMPQRPPDTDPVAAARAGTAAMFVHPAPPDLAVVDRTLAAGDAPIPVRIYTPRGARTPLPVLVYFHGGGFLAGSIESHDGTVRELAHRAGCVAVSVGYRLAPEHPYPAPFDDCIAALGWVGANAGEIGGDATRLAIGGDSAGANLCAAVALANRDRGGPPLACQLLVYPVVTPACATESMTTNGTGYMLTADSMRWMWAAYLAGAGRHDDPYVAPIAAASFAGLPPAVIITAEFDPLRDEGEAFARALAAGGVPTTVSRYGGQIHGFFSMYALAPQSFVATEQAARALRRAFAR